MSTADLARESFANLRRNSHAVLDGCPTEALTWRADPDANTIAWLMWHLARVQDDHIAHLAGRPQVWTADWATRLGLAADDDRIGYGDTSEQVGAIAPDGPAPLREYVDAVLDATTEWLDEVTDDADWERIIDRSYDPPVTAGVRLASVIDDNLQHVGQAAFVRGVFERTCR